jgi:hypothetical protein
MFGYWYVAQVNRLTINGPMWWHKSRLWYAIHINGPSSCSRYRVCKICLPNATIQTAPSGARLQSLVGCEQSNGEK